jgi:hypothetical protein|tara:strand:+ start:162 stop:440 length:279 start_codon:yes stop_codon:yes gene_type:complete
MKGKMKNKNKQFGNGLSFPKHLTPEIIHSALFVHNAPTKEDIIKRVEHCAKLIGDEAMQYAMALLILPHLVDSTRQSDDYQDWLDDRSKHMN